MESFIWKRVENGFYKNKKSVNDLIHYILRTDPDSNEIQVRFYGGTGVDYILCERAIRQMKAVKKYFKKKSGLQIWHFIFSCPSTITNPMKLYDFATKIIKEHLLDYQTMFAVHEDTDNLHVHFIVNSVSFLDGRKWHQELSEFYSMKDSIEKMAWHYFGFDKNITQLL